MPAGKEFPYCTLCLAIGALTCHTLVLLGNLHEATLLREIGRSSRGWSLVGTSIAGALDRELDPALSNVSAQLTNTLKAMMAVEESVDVLLSKSGSAADAALAVFVVTAPDPREITERRAEVFREKLHTRLHRLVHSLVEKVVLEVNVLISFLQPALRQVAAWLSSFSDRVQSALEDFGSTLDTAQKLFDQVMSLLHGSLGQSEEDMLYNTFTLFDTDNSGVVTAKNLQAVSTLYGVSALAGQKAYQLVGKYDVDGDAGLSPEEYTMFVHDPSLPGVMTVVLRTYSQKLLAITGTLAGARLRDEVATSVVDYLSLVCVKNVTKVEWVAETLTNGSLPLQFTADVLKELACNADDPNSLSELDVGSLVVGEMMRLNPSSTARALRLLTTPSFWQSEGFDPEEQPSVVQHVAQWMVNTPGGAAVVDGSLAVDLLQRRRQERPPPSGAGAASSSATAAMVAGMAQERQLQFRQAQRLSRHRQNNALYASSGAKALRTSVLGLHSSGAQDAEENPEVLQAVNQGKPALPATLDFASWLAANESTAAHSYMEDCFDYSMQSSGALDSFGKTISGLITKMQSLLGLMGDFASGGAPEELLGEARQFGGNLEQDVMAALENYTDQQLDAIMHKNLSHLAKDFQPTLTASSAFLDGTLQRLKDVLPTVLSTLKLARQEVSAVSNGIDSVMTVLGGKAPPIFHDIAQLYKVLWVIYYVVFTLVTLAVLIYGFWAEGYLDPCCDGPKPSGEETYEAPVSFWQRCQMCCASCCDCLRSCGEGQLSLWSLLLLAETILLITFVVAIILCLLTGVQAFLSLGCKLVYILGDSTVCTTGLLTTRQFLRTFWSGLSAPELKEIPIEHACDQERLLTCRLLSHELMNSMLSMVIGSILAAVFSFQFLVDVAQKHEHARFRRMLKIGSDGRALEPQPASSSS